MNSKVRFSILTAFRVSPTVEVYSMSAKLRL
jgi:hypothetical protein